MEADAAPVELSKEEKRARAIQLLAKAMGRTPVADDSSSDSSEDDAADAKAKRKAVAAAVAEAKRADEEVEFLRSLLASPSHDELTQTVRDRLSVLAVRRGEVTVAASNPRGGGAGRGGAPPPPQRLRRALELLQDGDASAVAPGESSARNSGAPLSGVGV